jgi:uncharacterized membrane protein YagU involved in acid resistance
MKNDLQAKQFSPLLCIIAGAASGALASGAQSLFFRLTAPLQPQTQPVVFNPPEEKQIGEREVETVARRLSEGVVKTKPLSKERKKRLGTLVHLGFGAAWGAIYGLLAESFPEKVMTPVGAAGFGAGVWMLSDNLLLPSAKLAAWPTQYPAKTHAYALAAHLVYGASVVGAYQACCAIFGSGRARVSDVQAVPVLDFWEAREVWDAGPVNAAQDQLRAS